MNIALIGYGKMGKTIEKLALKQSLTIGLICNSYEELVLSDLHNIDVAIEFTNPDAAFKNIKYCLEKGVKVVSGTTGWLDKKEEIEKIALQNHSAFFYASNFSIGVNIFFKVNEFLAKLMNVQNGYNIKMEEIHHTQKLDSPSGTAISLANQIIKQIERKKTWVEGNASNSDELEIHAKRFENVPGTHIVSYVSNVDTIEIKHEAHNREGFASGAILAALWINNKKGVFNMNDLLTL